MKVITKCIIDMKTLHVIEEDSHEYNGPVMLCKGGGGGSSSGKVDYPTHMKTWHNMALDHTGVDSLTSSLTDIMNAALGNDPFTGESAYNPDTELANMSTAGIQYLDTINLVNSLTNWTTAYDNVAVSIDWDSWVTHYTALKSSIDWDGITDAEIIADVAAFADQLDDELLTKVLPRFEAGMRDINAVNSSAFVIGKSVIEGMRDRDVAKHASVLRLEAAVKNLESDIEKEKVRIAATKTSLSDAMQKEALRIQGTDQSLKILLARIAWQETYTRLAIDTSRMKIVAKKEQNDFDVELAENAATWDLELFQYGGNLLASIGSGTVVAKQKKQNVAGSAIGGALTGAAGGAMVGSAVPVIGTAVGAVVGAVLGAASSLL